MTEEYKELLLRDLCARAPFGVMCDRLGKPHELLSVVPSCEYCFELNNDDYVSKFYTIEQVKPYLRSMSTMSDVERDEFNKVVSRYLDGWMEDDEEYSEWCLYDRTGIQNLVGGAIFYFNEMAPVYDWLNSHHFDYRGLIEKELALEAKENMYSNK